MDSMQKVREAIDSILQAQNLLLHAREDAETIRVSTVLDESILALNKTKDHLHAQLNPYGTIGRKTNA